MLVEYILFTVCLFDIVLLGSIVCTTFTSYLYHYEVKHVAPLFGSLCCSGSTGKPKGVLHTTAGYLLYAATTFKYVFDYRPGDVYWCTADVGWITGHTYVVYGPLANGATSVLVSNMFAFFSFTIRLA